MGRKSKVEGENEVKPKVKKPCSPELLERLKQMRIKADEAKRAKGLLTAKIKATKIVKQEALKKSAAEEFDKIVEVVAKKAEDPCVAPKQAKAEEPEPAPEPEEEPKQAPEPAPEPKPKKKVKKVIYESDSDEYEEVVVRRRRAAAAPKHDDDREIGALAKQAVQQQLKHRLNQEKIKAISSILAPEYY